jgi:hypothetical protein
MLWRLVKMAVRHNPIELKKYILEIADECKYHSSGSGGSCSGCPFLLDEYDFCGIASAHMHTEWRRAPKYWNTAEVKIMEANKYTEELKTAKPI